MKHKHYDMIVAKAANMDLVTLCRDTSNESHKWDEYVSLGFEGDIMQGAIPAFEDGYDYFLCLPQHKEACLHWLNGGQAQYKTIEHNEAWGDYTTNPIARWSPRNYFMDSALETRIKPKKEKRWLIYSDNAQSGNIYDHKPKCSCHHQLIEFEVEVKG